jgi:hypothetical protein
MVVSASGRFANASQDAAAAALSGSQAVQAIADRTVSVFDRLMSFS